jgi:hypothetical protein
VSSPSPHSSLFALLVTTLAACSSGESKPVADAKAGGAAAGSVEHAEPLPPGFVMPPVVAAGAPAYRAAPVTGGAR